jgi:hypothetical protein
VGVVRINQNKIVKRIQKIWPYLTYGIPGPTNIAIADETYWMPTRQKLEDLWTSTLLWQYQYSAEYMDCDDFALLLHALIVRDRYKQINEHKVPKGEWYSWAIGQCWGSRFKNNEGGHAINIAFTSDEGVLLLEPQALPATLKLNIWKPNKDEDQPFFIKL